MSEHIRVKGNIVEKTGGVSRVYAKEGIEHNSNGSIEYFAESYSYGGPEKYTPAQPENSVNVYCGMFFDGTGNNRFNSDSVYYSKIKSNDDKLSATDIPANKLTEIDVLDEKDKTKRIKVKITDRDSYWNPYSNIAKMFDLYKENKTKNYKDDDHPEYGIHVILKQYVEGIGTSKGEPDDILGSGLARSSWGILSRVREGIEKVVQEQFKEVDGKKINKIVFDVFGFSRGAAAARHFCNEVLKKESYRKEMKNDPHDKYPLPTGKTIIDEHAGGILGTLLSQHGHIPVKETYTIEIRFLGIYDTVISDIVLKDNLGMKLTPVSPLFPIAQATLAPIKTDLTNLNIGKVLHITAQSEWRANFALTPSQKGHTLSMIGAHSDVGGGYAELEKYEPVLDYFDADEEKINSGNEFWEEKKKLKNFYVNNAFCLNHPDRKETIQFLNTYDHYQVTNATPVIDKYLPVYTTESADRPSDYSSPKDKMYDPSKIHPVDERKISDHFILQDSRYINNKYSIVPLNLMLEYARQHDVPFYEKPSDSPNVKKNMLFEYKIPEEKGFDQLRQYLEIMRTILFDGKGTKYEIPSDLYHHIMNKYVHLSSHYGGLENDYIKVNGGDHNILASVVFVNHPVSYSFDENRQVKFKRETYVPE